MVNAGIQLKGEGDRVTAVCPKLGLSATAKTMEAALYDVKRQMVTTLKAILNELEYVERDELLEAMERACEQFTDETEYVAPNRGAELIRLKGRSPSKF